MPPVDKSAVVRVLREISLFLQLKDENAFKSRAYEVGADRIAGLTDDLETLVKTGKLSELPGIGPALNEKISELVTTGTLPYYEKLKAEFPPGIIELLRVPDLGPKKARQLWVDLKVGSVAELESACKDGRVRALKGFGPKSEGKILAGIDAYKKNAGLGERKRLGDVLAVARELEAQVKAAPGVIRASVAGSVRRFCETVSDVDIIASATSSGPVMEAFATHPQVASVIARGETKCSVRLWKNDLQCDLRVVPDEDYATALHHFTGSKAHHIRLRGLAKDKGMMISEWGVTREDGQKLPVPDEAALYALLGMQEVPPELREDWGEVEAALEGTLPKRLLTLADVQGGIHSHSTWSDGKATLEQMALTAQRMGLRYLTVTDHSQAAHYAGGLKPDDLERQWDEIDALNEKLDTLTLLKGSEVDILEDGSLDFSEDLLARMDVVICSIHVRHGLDEAAMTRRVLNAFDHPFCQILGHPTGRLINSREPYGLDMDRVMDKAAEKGVVIEVNGSPHRLDIKSEYVRKALQRGVKLCVSTDAHSTAELENNLLYAVGTARKGWATAADIVNTRSPEAFKAALRPH